MKIEKYFYSEEYIYQGTDTICKMYGTETEMQETGEKIVRKLNLACGNKCDNIKCTVKDCPYVYNEDIKCPL